MALCLRGYKALLEPAKLRAVMEGQRWGGERNQSTKRGGDKKEEDGRGKKKGRDGGRQEN